jgi:hypothetical protein
VYLNKWSRYRIGRSILEGFIIVVMKGKVICTVPKIRIYAYQCHLLQCTQNSDYLVFSYGMLPPTESQWAITLITLRM